MPHDFSEWHTVYRYCDMWRDKPDPTVDFLLEKLLKKLLVPIASRKADRPERRSSLLTRRH
ncbi:transposase [Lacticaseibacillus paracasei]|nr:transposase [Lacticaseibacillus casei 21/1]EKP97005.1 transposase [Lacticaseibacillus paracasei]EKQ06664.1 transposase [Lacticaseibacillus paracasei]